MRSNHENPSTPSSLVNAALAALSPASGSRLDCRGPGEDKRVKVRRRAAADRPDRAGGFILRLARARDAKGAR